MMRLAFESFDFTLAVVLNRFDNLCVFLVANDTRRHLRWRDKRLHQQLALLVTT